jgi:ferredoxin--NADP+ reductase
MVFSILKSEFLTPTTKLLEIDAPAIAKKARPGQFVVVRLNEKGERIPLTIAEWDRKKGSITLVVLEVGKTSAEMVRLNRGDALLNVAGPLGEAAETKKFGTVVCIGGGVGIAAILPEVRALRDSGNRVISIIGARTKDLLIYENEIRSSSDEFYITTDDGSYGRKGFVSDVLAELLSGEVKIDRVVAVGPVIMMKVVSDITFKAGITTIVSLNPIMVDGTGMCGSCRISIGEETKCVCIDGPEFDASLVDWSQLMERNSRYLKQEKKAYEAYKRKMGRKDEGKQK